MVIQGNFVDIFGQEIFSAELIIEGGIIKSIKRIRDMDTRLPYIIPGFIDAHVHIESSMLIPYEFARLALPHGTVATVSDPHEIANVCGISGIDFMIENGRKSPLKFYFGAPSCVPATPFETAGAELGSIEVGLLLKRKEIKYLSEMMNFPGVLNRDEEVLKKIKSAKLEGKPIDGHAPGLRGKDARLYAEAGISTDHECVSKEEGLDKLECGMKILIREGSAAKNFEALIGLLPDFPDKIMFCSDDKHPDSLLAGHINQLCARAVAKGINVFQVLKAACINPVLHYGLDVGLLREGDAGDFVLVKNLEQFEVLQTYINGRLVAESGKSIMPESMDSNEINLNNFRTKKKAVADFQYLIDISGKNPPEAEVSRLKVIEVVDGQLITNSFIGNFQTVNGRIASDSSIDILKIVVVNRYLDVLPAKGFVRNFGLKHGAIASSVAHDSHNIVAVGVDDESLCEAVNLIIEQKGGISCVNGKEKRILPLPVAGLMSNENAYFVATAYSSIDKLAKSLGSNLLAPFMSLSFMALLVIPHLKLSDLGLFDVDQFQFVGSKSSPY
jgi:adenine deaminase